ncbi:protein MOS2-like isoform X2 [Zingiber officinale]|uniref:protein MOS2-like isoform X2 n=1 Tax=Zingiber officinale TaxID=94328 RepID=UPI001C4AAE0E|nr:protein MOS2-like isoform X2 [Zingiber officinale]
MEKEAATKLSFSFSSSSKISSRPPASKLARPPANDGGSKPQFVTVFDPSAVPNPDDSKLVIAPIPNAYNNPTLKRMKNLLPLPTADDDPSSADTTTRFVLDTSTGDAPAGSIPYGLTLRSTDESRSHREEGGEPARGRSRAQDEDFRRYREDVKDRPGEQSMEAFEQVKVEDFAAAVLAGYGWKQGQVIGRNKDLADTKVFEYKRKGRSEGLGYNPSAGDPKKRRGSWVVEGSKEKAREKVSGEEVKLRDDMVAELGSAEEEKFLKKLKKSEYEYKSGKKENRKREERRSMESRREDNSNSVQQSTRSSDRNGAPKVQWLTSYIRVRIISKDFMGGKLYLKKGKVIDVVGPTTCDISMDGSQGLVQCVDQDILETALPKLGGSVLVLYGKHKGIFGNLVERNAEKGTGVVSEAGSHEIIKVKLDEIAEYLGDPSYLGY